MPSPRATADRYLDQTARAREQTVDLTSYKNGFNQKYVRDVPTQAGILGGDPSHPPMPRSSTKTPVKARSKPAALKMTPATPGTESVTRVKPAEKPAAGNAGSPPKSPPPMMWPQNGASWVADPRIQVASGPPKGMRNGSVQ